MVYLDTLQQILKALDPPIVAAIVAGLVALLTLVVNTLLQVWKASIDRQIAREKGQFDRDLAQQKFTYDVQLAERKMALDVRLSDRKRRTELAETVLTDVYRARAVITHVRGPSGGGEGSTRPPADGETEEQTRTLNSYFVAVERLQKEAELFARLQALQYRFQANFGEDARHPLDELRIVHNTIIATCHKLMNAARQSRPPTDRWIEKWEATIWLGADEPDNIATRVDDAVAALEAICAPIVQAESAPV